MLFVRGPRVASGGGDEERQGVVQLEEGERRGAYKSVQALEQDIRTWIAAGNTDSQALCLGQDRGRDP